MKNIIALVALLSLTACCGCPSMSKDAAMSSPMHAAMMGNKNLSCSTAKVSGMTCEACAITVTKNLKKLDGVKNVEVDVAAGQVKIFTDKSTSLSQDAVKNIVEKSGYQFQSMKPACQ